MKRRGLRVREGHHRGSLRPALALGPRKFAREHRTQDTSARTGEPQHAFERVPRLRAKPDQCRARCATRESSMSETFLVTGFEPFGGRPTNSSWNAIERLRPSWPGDIVSLLLPVDHRLAHERLRQALDERRPRVVLCTGLAEGMVFRVERCARRPSELDVSTAADEHALVYGRWPWLEMHTALAQVGARVIDSEDAGEYVCESTYWSLLTYAGQSSPPEFAAFLHVPHESEHNSIEHIAAAVDSVVQARRAALRSGLLTAPA